MIFCYMDEAGNTGEKIDDQSQPFHYVGGLLVEEKSWKTISTEMHRIATDSLGEELVSQPGFKFHGNQLFAGNGVWRSIDKDRRLAIYSECLALICRNHCRLIYGKCNKAKLQRYRQPMHPHEVGFWLCLERAARYAANSDSLVSLIAASSKIGLSKVAQECLTNYRKNGAPFGRTINIEHVVDQVQFISSVHSPHLQLCDLWLWVIQRLHTHDPKEDCVEDLYIEIEECFYDSATFPY